MSGNNVLIGGRFSVGPRLGAGMQAEVRAGIDQLTDSPIALKIIDKTQLKPRALTALEREVCHSFHSLSNPLSNSQIDLYYEDSFTSKCTWFTCI